MFRKIAIIADDLTGAADTGVQFCPYFDDVLLVAHDRISQEIIEPLSVSSHALAIYTNSRALQPVSCRQRLTKIAVRLQDLQLDWMYKKVDSCLRGNIGTEVDALVEKLTYDASFIAPAFPEMGRTTVNNVHMVHGTPVDRTEIAFDPVTPVTDARLSCVIESQSNHPVRHVHLKWLREPDDELRKTVTQILVDGVRHVTFDAQSQSDLEKIAETAFSLPYKILPVGSAGLASSMTAALRAKVSRSTAEHKKMPDGHLILVCGSASEVASRQIETLVANHPYETVSLAAALLTGPKAHAKLVSEARGAGKILAEKDLIIRTQSVADGGHITCSKTGMSDAGRIVEGLAVFVRALVDVVKPAGLFLTGGDTAAAVLDALGSTGVSVQGEVITGMVQGRIRGGLMDGSPVVTKAGAFGKPDALVRFHEYWNTTR